MNAVLFIALLASADGKTSSLSWVRLPGAESCVAGVELARTVEAKLGRPVFVPASSADVAVEGHVAPEPSGGFVATLALTSSTGAVLGRRELTAKTSCREMDEALVLVLSLLIDPEARQKPPPPVAQAPTPPAPVTAVAKRSSPEPSEPWHLDVAAGLVMAAGLAPGVSPGLTLEAAFSPGRVWTLELGGRLFLPSDAVVMGGAGGSVLVALGTAAFCRRFALPASLALAGCAGWEGGGIRVEPRGLMGGPSVIAGYLLDIRAHADLIALAFDPLILRVGAGVCVPLNRDRFTYTASGSTMTLFEVSPVAAELDLGVGLRVF
jgi:hypothetical protein